ncbi:hypothetical protein QN362_13715 [Actimicrobium sp. CCC2.4]|uniref:hypothetical protein n=1 Tax=Actimicrobium sp. CCC2.4 TaxID=3048606 RepID=UPI002AC98ED3|nr:hypothetical protein [Actimicrobium sp. CCC2.4]MEB0136394.1 hypothetical protein [Actimicrobium sp. CCC2.4]WPX31213.1 hypothetical protein RHM62_13270 [Actimicrobium sp. CCC2.4]
MSSNLTASANQILKARITYWYAGFFIAQNISTAIRCRNHSLMRYSTHQFLDRLQANLLIWSVTLLLVLEEDVAMIAFMLS